MPKRFTNSQRNYVEELVTKAEGDFCLICYFEKGIKRRNITRKDGRIEKRVILEHADNDPNNNTLGARGNIHHVCKAHNKIMESWPVDEKVALIFDYSAQIERERERKGLPTWKDVLPDNITYDHASAEVQLSKRYYPRWREFVISELREKGTIEKQALIAAAANASGCRLPTSRNYMTEITAYNGLLKEEVINGMKIIVFREEK